MSSLLSRLWRSSLTARFRYSSKIKSKAKVKHVFPSSFSEMIMQYRNYLDEQLTLLKKQNEEALSLGASAAVEKCYALGPLKCRSCTPDAVSDRTLVSMDLIFPGVSPMRLFSLRTIVYLCKGDEMAKLRTGVVTYRSARNIEIALKGLDRIDPTNQYFLMVFPLTYWRDSCDDFLRNFADKRWPATELIDLAFRKVQMPSIHHDPQPGNVICGPLNESQRRALAAALNKRRPFVCIQGPPGTGKTNLLLEVIAQIVRRKKRVLVLTPTRAALNNLMERVRVCPVRIATANVESLQEMLLNHPQYPEVEGSFADVERGIEKLEAKKLLGKMKREVLEETSVVFATAGSSLVRYLMQMKWHPSVVVVDEAAQLCESATWIAAVGASRIVLAGDPKQLPSFISITEKTGIGTSLMERLMTEFKNVNCSFLLEEQYRMNEKIMAWSNSRFYENRLHASPIVASQTLQDLCPPIDPQLAVPMVFFNTDLTGRGIQEERVVPSFRQKEEAEIVVAYIGYLLKHGLQPAQLGVITPYFAQSALIRHLLHDDPSFAVDTVDSFQGQEREVIIFSAVRNNRHGEFGFVTDPRRLNVAVTRARRQFALVGSERMLRRSELTSSLLQHLPSSPLSLIFPVPHGKRLKS